MSPPGAVIFRAMQRPPLTPAGPVRLFHHMCEINGTHAAFADAASHLKAPDR